MTTLHLISSHNPGFGWYFRWIFPLDRLLVLAAIFAGLVASVWREHAKPSHRIPSRSAPGAVHPARLMAGAGQGPAESR
jgi:predicted outer membrane lipoprotein